MPKYNVHLYVTERITYENIEEESQSEAVKSVVDNFDPSDLGRAEWAEEISGAMVDTVGDNEYTETREFDADGQVVIHTKEEA